MTTKQLSNLKNLKAEIKMYEEMIGELRALPKSISAKNGYLVAKIIDIKDKLSKDYAEIINYIENIDDPIISMILKYKYINNFSWQKTTFKVGGGNKADSLKKRLYRYLKNQKKFLFLSIKQRRFMQWLKHLKEFGYPKKLPTLKN